MAALIAALLLAAPSLRAVVYPDRAQVTRAGAATCGPRGASLIFDGLTPAADASSFRAVSADGAVMGVRTELRANDQAFTPEAEKVDAEIRAVELELRALQDTRGRAAQQSRLSDRMLDVASALISREMVQPAPDAAAWDGAFESSLKTRYASAASNAEVDAKQREARRKLEELRIKRALLGQAMQRQSYRAEVLLGCAQGAPVHAELSYIVGGASWEPTYEARADEKAGRVELSMFATVRQATGEDWKDAAIVLSTAIPRSDATPPEVRALRVGALERQAEKKVLVRRDEELQHAEEGGAAGGGEAGGGGPAEGLSAEAQGLSVQLRVKDPASLTGDGTPARLFVGAHKLAAAFAYRSVPKLMPYVFRVADLVNTAPFPLLPGPLDAFRRSGFIARTPLERVAEGQKFHLTFGLEDGLKVKRVVLDEIRRDAGFLNTKSRFRFAYKFEVENHLDRGETVELTDHLPVSELDDVNVEVEERTTKPSEYRKDDGIVTWKIAVPSGAKQAVELAFHVDVPSSYDASGM
jgi:uncharacterized protein (TIGR02231 family)